jgi:hypothetical protein
MMPVSVLPWTAAWPRICHDQDFRALVMVSTLRASSLAGYKAVWSQGMTARCHVARLSRAVGYLETPAERPCALLIGSARRTLL